MHLFIAVRLPLFFFIAVSIWFAALSAREPVQEKTLHAPAVSAPFVPQTTEHLHKESAMIDQEVQAYFSEQKEARLAKKKLDVQTSPHLQYFLEGHNDSNIYAFANRSGARTNWHRVQKGESIWSIARKYGINAKAILRANVSIKRRPLYIGEKITIPQKNSASTTASHSGSGVLRPYYWVKKGDSIYGIARKHRIPMARLLRMNGLTPRHTLKIGLRLRLRPLRSNKSRIPPGYRKESVFAWPLKGPITSGFGRRTNPFLRSRVSYHKGIDIGAKIGTPFKASSDGVVIRAQRMGGYGNCIFVLHKNDYISVYAHNKKNLVQKGQMIKKGEMIGLVGRTGSATGPHLHFEIRKLKKAINPLYAFKILKVVKIQEQLAYQN